MRLGKLTNEQLDNIILTKIKASKIKRDDIILRPGVGIDCGGIRFGNETCILSTDPITAAVENAGSLAVVVSVNDVASSGAEPVALLLTLLVPPETTAEEIERVISDATSEADRHNIEIIGGHTEITDAVNRIVLSATVIGKAVEHRSAAGAKPGDTLIMTKWAGLEGTAILAADHRQKLTAHISEEELCEALSLTDMLSVLPESRIAAKTASAMHDVTEGGVLGAAYEIAQASNCGITIFKEKIPILPITSQICELFDIDPLRLIGSGCLLICHHNGEALCETLSNAGIKATIIGHMTQTGYKIEHSGKKADLTPPDGDDLYKAGNPPLNQKA